MTSSGPSRRDLAPLVLFGAFDRHNLGDLLLAHVACRLAGEREVICAGLADRDLTAWGGHHVVALPRLLHEWPQRYGAAPLDLLHVGGETLTVDAWQAAVMLQSRDQAAALIRRLDADPPQRLGWARRELGTARLAPYVLARDELPCPGRVAFRAVGGVDLGRVEAPLRDEVLAALRQADALSVRDRVTQRSLAAAGIVAELEADPVTRIGKLFGPAIRARRRPGRPYLAVQLGAEFAADATLAAIAAQLEAVAAAHDVDIVCFSAGAAPWHDDPDVYRRLVGMIGHGRACLFDSLDIWDICALITHAKACCAASLHAAIVARAFAVPAVALLGDCSAGQGAKLAAWFATWGAGESPVHVDGIAARLTEIWP